MPATIVRKRTGRRRAPDPFAPPPATAKAAALRYLTDTGPGIRRSRSGRGFRYLSDDGTVRDRATLARIHSLVIPPAWTEVWISPLDNGHIQATGRDARGRKQYRYHPRWNTVRAETKYERMLSFGEALPRIREQIASDLARSGIPKEKVLAMVVRLLESTFIRVGNEEYARTNKSFGLTTMKDRHVEIDGTQIRFRFRGKSGKTHDVELADRRLARLVKQCRDLPGQDLFQYLGDDGEPHPIDSAAVNDYIREISGQEFTAKDFRTWAGSLLAARQLLPDHPIADDTARKSLRVATIAAVASQLGNTVAVCRKCYIHPTVLAAFDDQGLYDRWIGELGNSGAPDGLEPDEAALLRFLAATPVKATAAA